MVGQGMFSTMPSTTVDLIRMDGLQLIIIIIMTIMFCLIPNAQLNPDLDKFTWFSP